MFSLALIACMIALASAVAPRRVSMSAPRGSHHQWKSHGASDPNAMIKLTFAMKHKNVDELYGLVKRISDPKSDTYGDCQTLDDLAQFSDPKSAHQVYQWLHQSGVENIHMTKNGDFVSAYLPVSQANTILEADYQDFEHIVRKVKARRSASYTLPASIAPLVDYVGRTTSLPHIGATIMVSEASPTGNVSYALLKDYYNIKESDNINKVSSMSVYESLGQNYNPEDLKDFEEFFGLPELSSEYQHLVGNNDPSQCVFNQQGLQACGEAELDVQYITAVAQGIPITYWSMPSDDQAPFLDWIEAVAEDENPPLVHSISYGGPEATDDPSVTRFDQELAKMGARCLTVMAASGDDGVAGEEARQGAEYCGYVSQYPAGAPHITAVGATMGPEYGQTEVVCQSNQGGVVTSGGGFSQVFDQPSWQSDVVEEYLQSATLPPSSDFNAQGRGYPDVALLGHNYRIVIGGVGLPVSGTSASTPVFAGMVALVNNERLNAGKSPVGFLNPALYSIYSSDSSAFNDITSGVNNCAAGHPNSNPPITCCTDEEGNPAGFYATSGWDAVTGLGSVDFQTLADHLVNL